jgi:hypothetical protein
MNQIPDNRSRYRRGKPIMREEFFIPVSFDEGQRAVELWRCVIVQALLDLDNFDEAERRAARAWFLGHLQGDNFALVCLFANLDPQRLRKQVKELVQSLGNNRIPNRSIQRYQHLLSTLER